MNGGCRRCSRALFNGESLTGCGSEELEDVDFSSSTDERSAKALAVFVRMYRRRRVSSCLVSHAEPWSCSNRSEDKGRFC